jgi:hypothetical protein
MSTATYESQSLYQTSFDAVEQQRLLDEDSTALGSVSGILLTIVSAGLLLGIASLFVVLATS